MQNVESWKSIVNHIRLLEASYPIQIQQRKNRMHYLANRWANSRLSGDSTKDNLAQFLENEKELEAEGLSLESMRIPKEFELSKNLFLLKIGKLMEKEEKDFNTAAHIIAFQVRLKTSFSHLIYCTVYPELCSLHYYLYFAFDYLRNIGVLSISVLTGVGGYNTR